MAERRAQPVQFTSILSSQCAWRYLNPHQMNESIAGQNYTSRSSCIEFIYMQPKRQSGALDETNGRTDVAPGQTVAIKRRRGAPTTLTALLVWSTKWQMTSFKAAEFKADNLLNSDMVCQASRVRKEPEQLCLLTLCHSQSDTSPRHPPPPSLARYVTTTERHVLQPL